MDRVKPDNWKEMTSPQKLAWLANGQVSGWHRSFKWRKLIHHRKYERFRYSVFKLFGFWLPNLTKPPKWFK